MISSSRPTTVMAIDWDTQAPGEPFIQEASGGYSSLHCTHNCNREGLHLTQNHPPPANETIKNPLANH